MAEGVGRGFGKIGKQKRKCPSPPREYTGENSPPSPPPVTLLQKFASPHPPPCLKKNMPLCCCCGSTTVIIRVMSFSRKKSQKLCVKEITPPKKYLKNIAPPPSPQSPTHDNRLLNFRPFPPVFPPPTPPPPRAINNECSLSTQLT